MIHSGRSGSADARARPAARNVPWSTYPHLGRQMDHTHLHQPFSNRHLHHRFVFASRCKTYNGSDSPGFSDVHRVQHGSPKVELARSIFW